jgi:hypothetical protein
MEAVMTLRVEREVEEGEDKEGGGGGVVWRMEAKHTTLPSFTNSSATFSPFTHRPLTPPAPLRTSPSPIAHSRTFFE